MYEVKTYKVDPDVYFVEMTDTSNTAFVVGDEGVIVIDATAHPETGSKLREEIAKVTSKPVTTVILTHISGDCTGGLAAFPSGIEIISQYRGEKLMKRLVAEGHDGLTKDHMPTRLIDTYESLTIHGVKFELYDWGAAHMPSDMAVYLPEKKIVLAGTLIVRTIPGEVLIKDNMGAKYDTMLKAAQELIALDSDRYIVGYPHPQAPGEVLSKQQIQDIVDSMIASHDKVAELVAQGKSREEVIEETNAWPEGWERPTGKAARFFKTVPEVVYQELTAPADIVLKKVTDRVYVNAAKGSTVGFFVGDDEVLVIDAGKTDFAAEALLNEFKKISPNPVKRVVLTHSDPDHCVGLEGFPEGVEIIASTPCVANLKKNFEEPRLKHMNEYLPTRTFADELELDIAPEKAKLFYWGPAHSGEDVIVFLPGEKVAFTGDLVLRNDEGEKQLREPVVHRHLGGSAASLVQVLKKLIALDADVYVTSHGDKTLPKSDVQASLEQLEGIYATVQELVEKGKSLEEVKTELNVVDEPIFPGGPVFPKIQEVIYLELTEAK